MGDRASVKSKANAKATAKAKSVGRFGTYRNKLWLSTHHAMLLDMDWLTRHEFYDRLYRISPHGCIKLCTMFSPCQLLYGSKTGKVYKGRIAIPMPDGDVRRARRARQTLITEYFRYVRTVPALGNE